MFYEKKSGECEIWFGDCEITSVAKMATVNYRICRALLLEVVKLAKIAQTSGFFSDLSLYGLEHLNGR